MKIVFLEAAQNYGGARIATVDLANRLSYSHDVIMVDINGACKPFIDACIDKSIKLIIVDKKDKPIVIRSSRNILKVLWNAISNIPRMIFINKKLNILLNDIDADYVCINGFGVLYFLLHKKFRAKIIYFAHGWYLRKQISPINKFLCRQMVDKYICGSQATRHALYNNNMASLENLYVVHIGINEVELRSDIAEIPNSEGCFKILLAAGFTKDKGQHISLEIAKRLKNDGLKFKLILAGIIYKGVESQTYYNRINNMIKEYELSDYVELIVGKPNIINYFRATDILIHPSASEGLGMVILEAMILKKPVIANPVGGIIDMILDGYTGFLTRHNNIDDYVFYIHRLASSKHTYNYVSNNAYALIRDTFTIENQIENVNQAFN